MASQDFWNLQSKFRGKKEFNFYDKMVPQPFRVTPTPTPTPSLGPQVAAFLEPCCCDYTTDCGITPLFGRFNYVSGMKANFWDASAEPFLSGQTVVDYNETTVDVSGVTYIIDQWISNSFPLNVNITPSIYQFNGGCSVVREDECSYTYKKVLFEDCCSGEQVFFSSNADYIVTGQTYGIYDDKCYSAIEIYPTNDPLLPILIIDDNTNPNPCIACNSLREITCPTPTPTPSITASITPTATPSITPTITPTPSPTPEDCSSYENVCVDWSYLPVPPLQEYNGNYFAWRTGDLTQSGSDFTINCTGTTMMFTGNTAGGIGMMAYLAGTNSVVLGIYLPSSTGCGDTFQFTSQSTSNSVPFAFPCGGNLYPYLDSSSWASYSVCPSPTPSVTTSITPTPTPTPSPI